MPQTDFHVLPIGNGAVILYPLTQMARDWINKNVPADATRIGRGIKLSQDAGKAALHALLTSGARLAKVSELSTRAL